MKLKLVLLLASVVLIADSGCHFMGHGKKKENNAIATEVETGFRHRWIEHRVAELTAQGQAAAAAQQQATREFQEKYAYLNESGK